MLIKKLCIKCWTNYGDSRETEIGRETWRWTKEDEKEWKKGGIYCPPEYRESVGKPSRSIKNKPPAKCPFILEHILTSQGK